MTISLGKTSPWTVPRQRFVVEATGAGGRGLPSLLALALDADGGAVGAGVPVCHAFPRAHEGAMRLVADARPLGSSRPCERLEVDVASMPSEVASIALCVSFENGPSDASVDLLVGDDARRPEVARRTLSPPAGGPTVEFGRLQRGPNGWSYLAADRVHREGLTAMLARAVPPTRSAQEAASAGNAVDALLSAAAGEAVGGYCDVERRRAIVARAAAAGLPGAEAEIMLDVELERLRSANEAVLLARLDAVLGRFTDGDRKLDDKERRDALQLVCKPAAGYAQGLRHDVADRRVVQFCRERGVKVKVGLLRWAVP